MARDVTLYRQLGVADTVDGRFDALVLYVALMVRALTTQGDEGNRLAALVLEALVSELDRSIREMGVGDLSVGKKVKAMMSAYQGRSHAYDAALGANDGEKLKEALVRNLYRGKALEDDILEAMTARVVRDADILMQKAADLLKADQMIWEREATQ